VIKAPVSKVHNALSAVDGVTVWWSKETTGDYSKGENIDVCFNARCI